MEKYDRDDSLDRPQHLMHDHDDYNTYSLDWPENVFGESLDQDIEVGFNEELDGDADETAADDAAVAPADDDEDAEPTDDDLDEEDEEEADPAV